MAIYVKPINRWWTCK